MSGRRRLASVRPAQPRRPHNELALTAAEPIARGRGQGDSGCTSLAAVLVDIHSALVVMLLFECLDYIDILLCHYCH